MCGQVVNWEKGRHHTTSTPGLVMVEEAVRRAVVALQRVVMVVVSGSAMLLTARCTHDQSVTASPVGSPVMSCEWGINSSVQTAVMQRGTVSVMNGCNEVVGTGQMVGGKGVAGDVERDCLSRKRKGVDAAACPV